MTKTIFGTDAASEMTERESLERLRDGCGYAADCLLRMCRCVRCSVPIEATDLTQALAWFRQASGACAQLAHVQANPRYLDFRTQIDALRGGMMQAAVRQTAQAGYVLAKIGETMTIVGNAAATMAAAKPVSRQDVMTMLDRRAKEVVGG